MELILKPVMCPVRGKCNQIWLFLQPANLVIIMFFLDILLPLNSKVYIFIKYSTINILSE